MLRQAGDRVECGHERAHLGAREAPKRSIVQEVCEHLRDPDDPLRPKTMPSGVEDHAFFDLRNPKEYTFQNTEAWRVGWGVFTPYKSGIQVVVTAYEVNASERDVLVQLGVYTRAPRACVADENRALRTTLTAEASKALMESLRESSTNSRCVAVHNDKSKKIHHPHVLSILARVAQLERVRPIRDEMKDRWGAWEHFVLDPHVQVIAVPPSPVPIEEALCLFGHSKAYVDGIRPTDVTTPPYEAIDALGSKFVANKLTAQLPLRSSSLELVAERSGAFAHAEGMGALMDRLAIFDWEICWNKVYRDTASRRVAVLMANRCAEMAAERSPAEEEEVAVPSPTPSSVGSSPPSPPKALPSTKADKPARPAKPAKPRAAAKKSAESGEEEESEDESEDSEEEESDDDGEDAEEGEGEGSSDDDDEPIQARHERRNGSGVPPPPRAAPVVSTYVGGGAHSDSMSVTQTFTVDTAGAANGANAAALNALTPAMPLANAYRVAEVTIKYSRPLFQNKRKLSDAMG